MVQPSSPPGTRNDAVWVGKLKRYGNAASITIPKAMCRKLNITIGTLLVVRNRRNHHVTVTPLDLTDEPLGPED